MSAVHSSRYRCSTRRWSRAGIDVVHEADAVVHRHRERLRAAHAAAPAGGGQRPASVPPKRFAATAANVSYVPCTMPCVPM